MLVTFVSQCEKKALKRTRRILDAFANRIGSNVWQTAITEAGLKTVKQLLRQSATKSTAVSCYRVRSRQQTELVWIVGNRRKFNELGIVPVNWTRRNILHNEWENNWAYASSIQIIATIAALLHDIGKSTIGFQHKLRETSFQGDPYRHEWISLKLFELLLQDCQSDEQWLTRFANLKDWLPKQNLEKRLLSCSQDQTQLSTMPPLAQWVAWLIVTHHRLPPIESVFYNQKTIKRKQSHPQQATLNLRQFYHYLKPIDYWVKNPRSLEEMSKTKIRTFWQFDNLVIHSPIWQKSVKRWANKALADTTLQQLSEQAVKADRAISDPILLHLSRLCLMVGDHNYSSLKQDDPKCLKIKNSMPNLAANTNPAKKVVTGKTKDSKPIKQTLEEHLLGVGAFTAHFARVLPLIADEMPTIKHHDPLARPTGIERFKWQNHAFKLARTLADSSRDHGFFGINMASTGAGKTIGNARIMYALADPKKGARFTIALGLRVLTLQTGLSFRKNLHLNGEQLAILVGGSAHKKLFEMQYDQNNEEITGIVDEYRRPNASLETLNTFGSESSEDLVDEIVDIDTSLDYQYYEDLNLGTVINSSKARDLLFAPVVTCTLDHLISATECKRGGKYIASLLRLLSSDLILDEPDDFDIADLPALTRLLHLAGLMGRRVLLSSATLTPDLVIGLFEAYQEGRKLFNRSQNKPTANVVCAWFDEQGTSSTSQQCSSVPDFAKAHDAFSQQRARYLAKQPIRRKADILPLPLTYTKDTQSEFYQQLARHIVAGAVQLHADHHQTYPESKQQVSIGLVRIANVDNINHLARQLLPLSEQSQSIELPNNTVLHVVSYHAKQLLILRNSLESKLDRILDRSDPNVTLFDQAEIREALAEQPKKQHIFMILATAVAEVGRDHDYDWAIVEPSSMRSIIQLAGRVWRHRPNKVATTPNLLLLQYNIRYFRQNARRQTHSKQPIFTRPGFETAEIQTHSKDLNQLLTDEQLAQIDARPRIIRDNSSTDPASSSAKEPARTLSELEHKVMQNLLNNPQINYVNAYWDDGADANRAHIHLQQISPFRAGTPQDDWLIIPNMVNDPYFNESEDLLSNFEDIKTLDNTFTVFAADDVFDRGLSAASRQNKVILPLYGQTATSDRLSGQLFIDQFKDRSIKPWLVTTLNDEILTLKQKQPDYHVKQLAITYFSVSLDSIKLSNCKGWQFHEFFGFVRAGR